MRSITVLGNLASLTLWLWSVCYPVQNSKSFLTLLPNCPFLCTREPVNPLPTLAIWLSWYRLVTKGWGVSFRQTSFHCVTLGNFLCLSAPVFASVKWVGANNFLFNTLQELDGEPLFIFRSSGKFISLIIPARPGSLTSFSFKSRISTLVLKLVCILRRFSPSLLPRPTLRRRRASAGWIDGQRRRSLRQFSPVLGLGSLRTASSDPLRRCPAGKAAASPSLRGASERTTLQQR